MWKPAGRREDVMAGPKTQLWGKIRGTAQKSKSVVGTRQGIKKCKREGEGNLCVRQH